MMLAVNLLPWRRQQWQRRRRQSVVLLGCSLTLTGIALLAGWWRSNEALNQQQARLNEVSHRRDALQQQLRLQHSLLQQRDSLLRSQLVRQQQQAEHQRWQLFWQQLPALMPDTLWLNRVERRQGVLVLEGQAQSMLSVRDFRQQLMTQPLLAKVRPGHVQRLSGGDYRFTLQARVQEIANE
ncbi:PilN domain-containing protein [Pantoea sp. EA-12]|uniref:PilN domain-containing protein n=1 Tax=Pantoea sp. EA-12 TaxID=3043303 RepID=UPI0024B5E324|nr:PilN domain-containing protein [Pantoea sp. EA-12]MDI9222200.1 PilN domain-containing protein [Pantoea sp. EA-12]